MTHRTSRPPALVLALLAMNAIAYAAPPGLPEPGGYDAVALAQANAAIGPAFKAGRFDVVLDLGKQAFAAGGGADALETIAVAALRLGHASLAWSCYEAIAGDAVAPAKTKGRATNQLNALRGQVATIDVATRPEGAVLEIRGVAAGTSPLDVPLRAFPGKVELVAVFQDGERVARTVEAKAGAALRVELVGTESVPAVAVVPIAEPAPPTEAPAPPTEAPAPPTEAPAPPTEAPAPPIEAPAPPTEVPAPPTEMPAPPTKAPAPPTEMPAPPADQSLEQDDETPATQSEARRTAWEPGWGWIYALDGVGRGLLGPRRSLETSSVCEASGARTETRSRVSVQDAGGGGGLGASVGTQYLGEAAVAGGDFWGLHASLGVDAVALGVRQNAAQASVVGACARVEATAAPSFGYAVELPLVVGGLFAVGEGRADWAGLMLRAGLAPTLLLSGGAVDHLGVDPLGLELAVDFVDAGPSGVSGWEVAARVLPGLLDDAPATLTLRVGRRWWP